jgi:DNA mismatch endonuclease, patch repair protein
MDTVDKQTRSRIMSSVGRKDTGPEMSLRRALHNVGLRYRLHDRALPGSPDLVFPRFSSVIFVHGCYWHAHGCHRSTVPTSRKEFWVQKVSANKLRDDRNVQLLLERKWRVMVMWECVITGNAASLAPQLAHRVSKWLKSSEAFTVIPESPQRSRAASRSRKRAQ